MVLCLKYKAWNKKKESALQTLKVTSEFPDLFVINTQDAIYVFFSTEEMPPCKITLQKHSFVSMALFS